MPTRFHALIIAAVIPFLLFTASSPIPSRTGDNSPELLSTIPASLPPDPPVILKGRLFFDIDLSGTQNEVRIKYFNGLIHPLDHLQSQNPDLVKALESYIQSHPETIEGSIISFQEPGLSNIEVCASNKKISNLCIRTGENGDFAIAHILISPGDPVGMTFTDRNSGPFQKMTYQNRFVKMVTIPPYEMNGIKVPEQKLTQTHLMKITNTYYVNAGEKNISIGLVQGVLPYPLLKGQQQIRSFLDHDPRVGHGLDWRGKTGIKKRDIGLMPDGVNDNHDGIEIGGKAGDFVLSVGFGMATSRDLASTGKQVAVMVDNYPRLFNYTHLDTILISNIQEVFTGMIIGTIGNQNGKSGSPYFRFEVGNSGYDPFGHPEGKYEQLWTRSFSPVEFP